MDRSLDEIIAERPNQNQNRGRRQPQNRRRDGVKKPYRDERVDLDRDWVHDKFEDDRDARPYRSQRRTHGDQYSSSLDQGAKIRVENLHYDITESDLEDLFSRIGTISAVSLVYDRAGRSEGIAYVTYDRVGDARRAISEFDGANAKGQPVRLTLLPPGGGGRRDRNPFDNVEKPKGSLFDRVERPRERDARSLSPGNDRDNNGDRRRGGRRGEGRIRRSDVSKPAPDHIDRYVPRQRTSPRRTGGAGAGAGAGANRRQGGGERRDDKTKGDRRAPNSRPRKTQEELDQEMEDYWGTAKSGAGTEEQAGAGVADAGSAAPVAAETQAATAPVVNDDDIDMIE